ncbi:uncharacterized protein LOC110853358 [Folsomia candida]|uniref:Uncharacterized protein n=1 Tax=Folsomia candida TaxID=158441 RepID=A0A226E1C8_FOLCA|nr:uncharacterized protein LOC110853358 [Folsomia candida]OXA51100.1 hypothetical protein Fcan01_14354 [Folsomia candida]
MRNSNLISCMVVVLVAYFGRADAAVWNDFRVKYDINPIGNFNRQPQLESGAITLGWAPVTTGNDCQNGGEYLGFRYIMPGDNSLGLIYDVNGVIAGLQMMLPHDLILPNNTFNFGANTFFKNVTYDKEYFVLTAYIVEPEIICTTGRNESDLIDVGIGTGVWVQDGASPGTYLQIPDLREEALNSGWSNNNCFGGMGTHSWYRMEDYEATNCTEQVPVFGLWSRTMELQGFGFSVPGTTVNKNFENPPTVAMQLIAGAPAPQCLFDSNNLIGSTTMHVYFINNPWLIAC